ncbi:hypothetical protein RJ639_001392 [Escallonia herrerae]|uniref:Uncharacterized protein n=1 Tax=Escallonia herrerae TaxID=1293975 RepID=A0AA88XFB2_9ASTE|nr:hypothetical protein RJ639_001392 [Escallonia herrerae]
MFLSSNDGTPLSYTNSTTCDENPYSRQESQDQEEDLSFSLQHFPSPFLDDNEFFLSQIKPLQHPYMASHGGQAEIDTNNSVGVTNMKSSEISSSTNENERSPPQITQDVNKQRRTGKKDRHTKIYTAQGLRARRMRLSLQIARQFFDLQDMLGFDKASKTIEWLFSKSKKAIKDLMPKNHPPQVVEKNNGKTLSECKSFVGTGEKNKRKSQKGANNSNARETRDKARARARERTREKMRMRLQLNTCTSLTQLGSSSGLNFTPFETDYELSSRTEEKNSPLESCSPSNITDLASGVGVIEKFLGRFESSSISCSNVDYQEDAAVSGILGNMEINRSIINPTGSGTTSMYQLTGKVYEENDSFNIHFQSW